MNEVLSSDPRIIPHLMRYHTEPNSRGDLIDIEFDPSVTQIQVIKLLFSLIMIMMRIIPKRHKLPYMIFINSKN